MTTIQKTALHSIPKYVQTFLNTHKNVLEKWNEVTPLARNEWVCWIISAKKSETRIGRIERMHQNLLQGKKRPCCWAGCPHR